MFLKLKGTILMMFYSEREVNKMNKVVIKTLSMTSLEIAEMTGVDVVYVYGEDGKVKIGRTKNIKRRMKTLRLSTGEFGRVFARPFNNTYGTEKQIHSIFAKHRLQGEWFSLTFTEAAKVVSDMTDVFVRRSKKEVDCIEVVKRVIEHFNPKPEVVCLEKYAKYKLLLDAFTELCDKHGVGDVKFCASLYRMGATIKDIEEELVIQRKILERKYLGESE